MGLGHEANIAEDDGATYSNDMKFSETTVAAFATASGLGATTAGAACCVLPLMLAGIGVGAGSLNSLVPLRTPLAVLALLAVATGWILHLRRRKACAVGNDCAESSNMTLVLLVISSVLVAVSGAWPFIEALLMKALGE